MGVIQTGIGGGEREGYAFTMSPIGTSNFLCSCSPNDNINAGRRRDRHHARLGGNRQRIECHLPIAGIIRAMAVGEVGLRDWWKVLRREIGSGAWLGIILGVIGFIRILRWQSLQFYDYGAHFFSYE